MTDDCDLSTRKSRLRQLPSRPQGSGAQSQLYSHKANSYSGSRWQSAGVASHTTTFNARSPSTSVASADNTRSGSRLGLLEPASSSRGACVNPIHIYIFGSNLSETVVDEFIGRDLRRHGLQYSVQQSDGRARVVRPTASTCFGPLSFSTATHSNGRTEAPDPSSHSPYSTRVSEPQRAADEWLRHHARGV